MPAPHIAAVQFRPTKADYAANLDRVAGALLELAEWERVPDIVVFPETTTSGYFLEGGVRDLAVTQDRMLADLAACHAAAGAPPMDVVIGFYEEFENHYHNSALYASLGTDEAVARHVHRKIFLPTYGVFDERRFVQSGHAISAFDTKWGRVAMAICEDAWHSITPALAALDGARFLLVPAASPARGLVPAKVRVVGPDDERLPASLERWELLGRMIAGEHGVFIVLAQLVGFEGGKAFPGASLIVGPEGDVRARGPLFEEAFVVAECDTDDITRARADMPLLADLAAELSNLMQRRPAADPDVAIVRHAAASVKPQPRRGNLTVVREVAPADPLAIDPELMRHWLVAFIREELTLRRGFDKGIVGLSGGVDSTLTAFLAAEALGPDNVIGVRMPYATSSEESLTHAQQVADQLGIRLETVDITAAVDGYVQATLDAPDPTRMGNVMARVRMVTLFDLSAGLVALPLGTGNKTERLLGYFTWHADDSPPVNPVGDLFKTQVWELARHMGVPAEIVDKPATADLIRGQTDEADLGITYAKADVILHGLLSGRRLERIVQGDITAADVVRVRDRLEATHWKRSLPTVAMVSHTAIGEYYLRPVDY